MAIDNTLTNSNIFRFNQQDVTVTKKVRRYNGFFKIDELSLSHALYSGGHSRVFSRELFERGDAVVVLPYDRHNDCVVFTEQFRVGALKREFSPWLLEFVAGMFGENESPVDVALRELVEEANIHIKAEQLHFILKYLSSPGGTSEQIHLYWADIDSSKVSGIHGLAEEDEDIMLHVVSREQALTLLAEGKINNASSVIGLQWLALNYQQLLER
jgi:ADP-ribose pyrophosphatase